jgi:hypothetical protein
MAGRGVATGHTGAALVLTRDSYVRLGQETRRHVPRGATRTISNVPSKRAAR